MYPTVPPPLNDTGAWSIPRYLQRWLDINPVTKLTRTQAFITLPAFSQAVSWQGYSDIVVAFNFEGPNNFSLTGFNVEPSPIPDYLLCIMWKDSLDNIHRYKLWSDVGEILFFDIPLYAGQKIAKNFRFEIWSTNVATVSQMTDISIYTSVLGKVDYRYGVDFTLVGTAGLVSAFGDTQTYTPIVLPQTNLWSQWIASNGVVGTNWSINSSPAGVTAIAGGNAGNIAVTTDVNINNATLITNSNTLLYSYGTQAMSGATVIYALVKPIAFNAGRYWFAFSNTASFFGGSYCKVTTLDGAGNIAIDGNAIGQMTVNVWHVLCIIMDFTSQVVGGYVLPLANPLVEPVFSLVSDTNAVQPSVITVGSNTLFQVTESFYLADLAVYNVAILPTLRNAILAYFANNYGPFSFTLPLVFPTNSTPQPN